MTADDVRDASTLVVLSPHFDDAALSMGLTLAWRTARDKRSVVVNVFGGTPSAPGERAYVERRADEDGRALDRLGVTDVRRVGFLDAIYRTVGDGPTRRYPTPESLFYPSHPEDEAMVPDLVNRVIDEIVGLADDDVVLVVPLSIGNHIDHRLGLLAGRLLARQGLTVVAFEDLPYAFDPDMIENALDGLGVRAWRHVAVPGDERALAAKLAAVGCYTSQEDWFRRERVVERLATHARARGPVGPHERVWIVEG